MNQLLSECQGWPGLLSVVVSGVNHASELNIKYQFTNLNLNSSAIDGDDSRY